MIRVVVSPRRIAVSGHSGYGGRGRDIVCAAASILMEATAAAVRARGVPAAIDAGAGSFTITTAAEDGHLLETTRQGFALLAQHYGRYVTVQHLQTGGTTDAGRTHTEHHGGYGGTDRSVCGDASGEYTGQCRGI